MRQVGLSVKDLYEYLQGEMKKGHGDYKVFVTDDEEANGYHALYYLGPTAQEIAEQDEDVLQTLEESNHNISILEGENKKAIYMG